MTATLGATSGRVQAAHSMTGKQAALKVGFKTAEQINCKEGAEIDEEDSGRCRRRVLEGGWKEGRFFDNVDVEAIAGCAASAFRRCNYTCGRLYARIALVTFASLPG